MDADILGIVKGASAAAVEIAHHAEVKALRGALSEAEELLKIAASSIQGVPRRQFLRPGETRKATVALVHAYVALHRAHAAVGQVNPAAQPAEVAALGLDAARKAVWVATVRVGMAGGLALAARRGTRAGSLSAEFAELYRAHPGTSAAKLNDMLRYPMDDSNARRLRRRLKPRG